MDKHQEKEIIKQAQKDPEAFGAIFEEYYGSIFGYILKRTGNVHVAQDIVSETFFKALDRLWQFKWRNISISSWLYRIATNEINQYFRKQKKHTYSLEAMLKTSGIEISDERDMLEEIMEQEAELERAVAWKQARQRIHELPEKYQEVLSLRFFEDKKVTEIAEILNRKEGTVKAQLSRGTAMLRESLHEMQPTDAERVIDTDAISPASPHKPNV